MKQRTPMKNTASIAKGIRGTTIILAKIPYTDIDPENFNNKGRENICTAKEEDTISLSPNLSVTKLKKCFDALPRSISPKVQAKLN